MEPPSTPLPERMRPQSLDDVVGQPHLTGPGGVLRRAVESGRLPSMILWGRPGTGKTTLAGILAQQAKRPFFQLSAISSGVKDVREVIGKAKTRPGSVLFIDEIHRFNKAQQDALLGAVEKGIVTLIGATTENPSFEVNAALLSRAQVYTLRDLEPEGLKALLEKAIAEDKYLAKLNIELKETDALLALSGGDARRLLNLLQLSVDAARDEADDKTTIVLTNKIATRVAQSKAAIYDKSGEQHYDVVSAFIKSIRGSDPDAAVYWLARMIEGGEDALFIARRMVILASEDIGNANPTALALASSGFESARQVGFPEASIILSHVAVYLAASPKSNATYMALKRAQAAVKATGDLAVPLHLRNAPTKLMKKLGYGADYVYPHDEPGHFARQQYLPDELDGTAFYQPADNPRENEMRKRLEAFWGKRKGWEGKAF